MHITLYALTGPLTLIFDELHLGAAYRENSGNTIYVVETHLTYARELKKGDPFVVETILADADEKRLHLYQRMLHAGTLYATSEVLCLHVDQRGERPRAMPFPSPQAAFTRELIRAQNAVPRELGRSILIRRRAFAGSS